MKQGWTDGERLEHWMLSSKELDLISGRKTDHNLLGAACLLKYFQYEDPTFRRKVDGKKDFR